MISDHWIGNEGLRQSIHNALKQGRFSHAVVLDGKRGIGKMKLARWVASWLFCKSAEERPCGVCDSCIKLETENHPDLLVIEPEEGSIKNHQIEGFQEFLQLKAYYGGHKVIIIDDADTMTTSAQNRILKVLEEPPAGTHVLMLTTQFNRLLTTILSRSQVLRLADLSAAGIASYLVNHYNIDRQRGDYLAQLASGSLGQAIALLEKNESDGSDALIQNWMRGYETKDLLGLLSLVDQNEGKADWEMVLARLLYEGNQKMVFAASGTDMAEITKWIQFNQHVEDCLRVLREQVNERIALDVMILRLLEGSNDRSNRSSV